MIQSFPARDVAAAESFTPTRFPIKAHPRKNETTNASARLTGAMNRCQRTRARHRRCQRVQKAIGVESPRTALSRRMQVAMTANEPKKIIAYICAPSNFGCIVSWEYIREQL